MRMGSNDLHASQSDQFHVGTVRFHPPEQFQPCAGSDDDSDECGMDLVPRVEQLKTPTWMDRCDDKHDEKMRSDGHSDDDTDIDWEKSPHSGHELCPPVGVGRGLANIHTYVQNKRPQRGQVKFTESSSFSSLSQKRSIRQATNKQKHVCLGERSN